MIIIRMGKKVDAYLEEEKDTFTAGGNKNLELILLSSLKRHLYLQEMKGARRRILLSLLFHVRYLVLEHNSF